MISAQGSKTYNRLQFPAEDVKAKAAGRWPEILAATCGFSFGLLDGKHHPCPKCGGTDRFRAVDADAGAVLCNQCARTGIGDGFATIQWFRGCNFSEALRLVAEFLGIARAKRDETEIEILPWVDELAQLWCLWKPGTSVDALIACGAQRAKYRGQRYVIAIPVFGFDGRPKNDWAVYDITGSEFPRFDKNGEYTGAAKMKLTKGCQTGVLGTVDRIADASEVFLVEGPTDLLALLTVNPAACVLSNPFGCGEKPGLFPNLLAGKSVVVVRDCDLPGQDGANRWCAAFLEKSTQVKNVVLPFPIKPDHGQDLRDWFAERGGTWPIFRDMVDQAKPFLAEEFKAKRKFDDPTQLATEFLEWQQKSLRRRLVYWRQSWFVYQEPAYAAKTQEELRGELWAFIDQRFIEASKDNPSELEFVPKVTTFIVSAAMAAIASRCSIPDRVEQNSWLDDEWKTAKKRTMANMATGILDLDALLEGQPPEDCILPHSDRWFSVNSFPYDFAWGIQGGSESSAVITEHPERYVARLERGEVLEWRSIEEEDLDRICPMWMQTLRQNLQDDQEKLALVQEWAGYCITQDTIFQKFLLCVGEGANGKSVYCAGLQAILGEDNCSMVPLELFGDRFAKTQTLGKLLNICSDAGEIDRLAEGFLKAFTSGDRMFFDRKGLPGIEVVPTAKMVVCCNQLPHIKDKSDGIWRRMMLLPWTYQVPEEDQVYGLDRASFWRNSGELPGMLAWAVFGAKRLLTNRRFTKPRAAEDAKENYRTEMNSVRVFLQEDFEPGSEIEWIASQDLFFEYMKWCEDTNHKAFNRDTFSKEVCKFLSCSVCFKKGSDRKTIRVFSGIRKKADSMLF